MSLTYHIHTGLTDIKKLEAEWHDLHTNSVSPSIYNQFDFVFLSIKHFTCSEARPFILSIHYQDKLIGIFFLQTCIEKRMGLKVKVIEFGALDEIDKPFPVIHLHHIERCWHGFFDFLKHNGNWDILSFIEQQEASIHQLSTLSKNFSMPHRVNSDKSGPIIDLSQSWDVFWEGHRKMRKKLYKMEKDFSDRLSFNVKTGSQLLDDYIQVESNSWKLGKLGISKDKETLSFYQDIAHKLGDQFIIGVLYVDQTPVSAEIAYANNTTLYFCQGCYRQDYQKYSPGMVSTSLFIKHFMQEGNYTTGDFLCGYAGYLNAWSDQKVTTERIDIYKPNLITRLFFTLRALNKVTPTPIKKIAKDTYALLKNNT